MVTKEIVRYLVLAALLATTAWMSLEPGWDSVIGFFSALAAFIGVDVYRKAPTGEKADRELLSKFQELLPSSFVAGHFAEVPFSGGHRSGTFAPFFTLVDGWKGPEFQFNHNAVQKSFLRLRNSITEFVHYLAGNTFPLNDDIHGVPPEWDDEKPELYRETVDKLGRLADQVVRDYDAFVTLAKKKLDE